MTGDLTEESAAAVLREAGKLIGLDVSHAELLRLGSNAVYRLAHAPVVIRIARDPASMKSMTRAVRVTRWLEEQGFPATRVIAGVEQPALISGRVVTFWENAQDTLEYASLPDLGDLLRRLHRLEVPEDVRLPHFEPFTEVQRGLGMLDGISDRDRTFFEDRAETLRKDYNQLDFALPFGLIHGDANVGNALRGQDGRALLMDLDGICLAQREWDLILTALYYDRFAWHTRSEYDSFVQHYGFDIMNWPGYPVLADLRELMMTLWLGQQVNTQARSAEEFRRRVHDIRTGGSRRGWQPF